MTSRPCRRDAPARPFREQIAFSGQFLEIMSRKRDLLLPQIAFSGQNRRLLSGKSDLRLFVSPLMRCGPRGSLGCAPLGRPQNRSQRVDRPCWTAASAYGSLPACPARLDPVDSPLMRIALCAPRSAAVSRPGRPWPARSFDPLLRPAPRSGSVEGCDKDVLPSALSCPRPVVGYGRSGACAGAPSFRTSTVGVYTRQQKCSSPGTPSPPVQSLSRTRNASSWPSSSVSRVSKTRLWS